MAINKIDLDSWQFPALPAEIPHGDMPGDKVEIGEKHIKKAQTIFPLLAEKIHDLAQDKVVVSVYGGSGVGKSEIASLLSFYLNAAGIGAYTMSGDNYPHRIPKNNDAMREQVFEEKGKDGLREYLGSELEINFKEVNEILRQFHEGQSPIFLRRMGRTETELWYEPVDFSGVSVLILEWTHGNNKHLRGVDIPIFLGSTPAETLAHRISRNRDGNPDSPFVTMVLEMEQDLLTSQGDRAAVIISKSGDVITFEDYLEKINEGK